VKARGFVMREAAQATTIPTVSRQSGPDGLPYYDWQVIDNMGWTLASGTVHGSDPRRLNKPERRSLRCQGVPVVAENGELDRWPARGPFVTWLGELENVSHLHAVTNFRP
jgi:hypothetical protein